MESDSPKFRSPLHLLGRSLYRSVSALSAHLGVIIPASQGRCTDSRKAFLVLQAAASTQEVWLVLSHKEEGACGWKEAEGMQGKAKGWRCLEMRQDKDVSGGPHLGPPL